MAPWNGPRHRSWASDTVLSTVGFAIVFVTYIAWEIFETAPPGIVALLGVAGTTWFGAVSRDKGKREAEVAVQAERTEKKVDALTDASDREHPGTAAEVAEAVSEDRGKKP